MLGSPNYVRFVYDGDGSAGGDAGPAGSDAIEGIFTDYFGAKGLASEPTDFDGRSDYGPFIEAGIPAGGLFSGAEGVKTPEEAAVYGGRRVSRTTRAITQRATTSPTSTPPPCTSSVTPRLMRQRC